MSEPLDWEIKHDFQPKSDEVAFDLDSVLSSVVGLRAEIPEDAFTAPTLGTERAGNGIVIGEKGLVLTIGYLITEAEKVWLSTLGGIAVPAHVAAYDQETGFGLVQALGRLEVPPMRLGRAADLAEGEAVIVAGFGGRRRSINARIAAKREFAGYWEYVLEEAMFTTPAHPNWGGAALVAGDGSLRGIGSLFVQLSGPRDETIDGNMVVPIDLLPPIQDELLRYGRRNKPSRPWLGMYTTETPEGLLVAGLANRGPAQRAGVRVGDRVLAVGGAAPKNLADLFRKIWALGVAGVEVPITVSREDTPKNLTVRSAARSDFLKAPKLH